MEKKYRSNGNSSISKVNTEVFNTFIRFLFFVCALIRAPTEETFLHFSISEELISLTESRSRGSCY